MKDFKYKVRFHLAKGKHFGHFQIRDKNGIVEFVDPKKSFIRFRNCYLHNQPKTSLKILNGENKRPCAWFCANEYWTLPKEEFLPFSDYEEIAFNPRIDSHWNLLLGDNIIQTNIDGSFCASAVTSGRSILLTSCLF